MDRSSKGARVSPDGLVEFDACLLKLILTSE